jgi:hypothetical protein
MKEPADEVDLPAVSRSTTCFGARFSYLKKPPLYIKLNNYISNVSCPRLCIVRPVLRCVGAAADMPSALPRLPLPRLT